MGMVRPRDSRTNSDRQASRVHRLAIMARLEEILASLGDDRSGFKDGAISAMGGVTSMLTS